jgi:alkylhydroperoxidase family enzyme
MATSSPTADTGHDTDEPASGGDALRAIAPDAAMAVDAMVEAAWAAARRADLVDLVARIAEVTAAVHDLTPLTPPEGLGGGRHHPSPDPDPDHTTVLAFAEQFAVDVAAIDDDRRAALGAAAGAATGDLVQAMYVVDLVPRVHAALDALFGPSDWSLPSSTGAHALGDGPELWTAIDGYIRVVPRLDALDPVLTELVRLRGARQHQCRLCQSLRSRPALLAGADDGDFAAVDDHAHSDLLADQKAALALTDAMIWTPARIPAPVADAVRGHLSDAQAVELVLDVARNATNKIAVAFAADAPHVDDGYEIYEIDADGEAIYGLTLD